MQTAPIPENENERLVSLHNLGLLDTPPEKRFDLITQTATRIFHVPISTLTLVDSKREWFKSCQGLGRHEGDRAVSFCGHALLSTDIMIVPDTKKDPRFADNPMVVGKPYIRFYAGVPVMTTGGLRVGVFCIKDTKPREFSKDDEEVLKGLASWAEGEINSRNLGLAIKEEQRIQTELKIQTQKLEKLDKSRERSEKAMLNVMEDLESAKTIIEIEKAKDEAMLASIGDGLVAVDNQGKVMIMNRTAEKMLGWRIEDLVGKVLTDLPLSDEEGNMIPFNKRPTTIALASGKITKVSYYFIRKDKTMFPMAITATPIKLSGKTIGLIELLRDVTHELEIDKAKSEFVSLASHQLRTPLGIIKWYLEALGQEDYIKKSPGVIRKYFDEVHKSNERILSLVRDLLSVSRIEQGRVKDDPRPTNLIRAIEEIVEQMRVVANKKDIILTLNIKDRNIPRINIDVLRLHEVIENLINNAIEYTVSEGAVHVIVNKVDNTLLISVKDTGIGISESDQKKLFTKFFRGENAIGYNSEGSGLGLYVVKSYIEGWGGKITAESVKGRGSTFTISLPMDKIINERG